MIQPSIEVAEAPPRLISTEYFAHPVASVWLAHTEALYLKEWWAPAGYENTWVEVNPEVGGNWRVVQRDPEGNSFSFYGHFSEVERASRLVQTRTSEIFPEATTTVTVEFSPTPEGTQVVTTQAFLSDFNLQGFLALGGVERMRGASDRLDQLLNEMAPPTV